MCVSCFCGVVYCVLCVVLGAGVGVQCVVCGVCGVCCLCGAAWHAENPVCRFQTSPCVGSKRIRVYSAKRRIVEHMRSFCQYTRRRLNLHTETFGNLHKGCLSLSLSSPSLFLLVLSSLSLFLRAFLVLFSLLFTLSNNDNDHSSSRLSPVYTRALTCLSVLWLIPCRTCSHHARNNCPGITVQTSCHLERSGHVSVLEMGDVFVSGCVWLCLVVLVRVVFVVLLVASVLASMRGCCAVVTVQKEKRRL